MTNAGYENLLYELGTELTRDPEIELKRLVYICRKKIPAERREVINDIFELFDELEKSGDLSIDNLSFLKEVLAELSKHDLLVSAGHVCCIQWLHSRLSREAPSSRQNMEELQQLKESIIMSVDCREEQTSEKVRVCSG